ncbi:histidine phosphatase family protein [Lentimicrobium sp. L6]|uniref:histidine phosphatase family protein n=1 Tax=Lentimicrobium sp. L6 TaxID=2735916 RepID=UPI0015563E13|nr:histidine phosphatase family protein [Lentimicrobium sp. L6]NPD86999.1 histidine phosphatase family protein [Lentimicrobium sp. L6]
MKKKIYLIRHSESTKNIQDVFGDEKAHFELTSKGKQTIARLAGYLKKEFNDLSKETLFLTSPDLRSLDTTKILTALVNCNFEIIQTLKPIKAGELSGISEDEAKVKYSKLMKNKALYRKRKLSGYEISYPKGEDVRTFQNRVIKDFNLILNKDYNRFFIITHQSIITAILSYIKSNNANVDFYYFYQLDLCGISSIDCEVGRYDIKYTNRLL